MLVEFGNKWMKKILSAASSSLAVVRDRAAYFRLGLLTSAVGASMLEGSGGILPRKILEPLESLKMLLILSIIG